MRIFLILQDDPFYLYGEIDIILKKYDVVGVTVLGQRLPADSFCVMVRRYINVFGLLGFFKLGIKFFYKKFICGKNLKKKLISLGIDCIDTDCVNQKNYISKIQHYRPDLLVSIACPQKFGGDLLSVPKIGAINLHGGYLPDFPGVFTPFWNLYYGSTYGGCSVHWMSDSIDGGKIILRDKFEIINTMTIMEIYKSISKVGIKLLARAIELIQTNDYVNIPNHGFAENYNTFPTKKDGEVFRKKGLRAI